MRPYEAVLILESSVDDSVVDDWVKRVGDVVKAKSGSVGTVHKWGRKRFAYEMNHKWEGNYSVIELDTEPAAVAEIDRMFTLADDVLRHKIVRLPDSFAGGNRPATTTSAAEPPAESETRSNRNER